MVGERAEQMNAKGQVDLGRWDTLGRWWWQPSSVPVLLLPTPPSPLVLPATEDEDSVVMYPCQLDVAAGTWFSQFVFMAFKGRGGNIRRSPPGPPVRHSPSIYYVVLLCGTEEDNFMASWWEEAVMMLPEGQCEQGEGRLIVIVKTPYQEESWRLQGVGSWSGW